MSTASRRRYLRAMAAQDAVPEMPLFGRLRVEELRPAAPDGEAWYVEAVARVRAQVAERGYVTASLVRNDPLLPDPPHPAHWGALWARLRALGLERTGEEAPSRVGTRNAAREAVWRPGPGWGREP